VELCPRGTFASAGLYLIHARFDATHDGAAFGIRGYVGRTATRDPAHVRIRNANLTFVATQEHLQLRSTPETSRPPTADAP
jgi:hypothetical protein